CAGNMLKEVMTSVFFFFQAEDGIRDWSVTGVQTCALPIFFPPRLAELGAAGERLAELLHVRSQDVNTFRALEKLADLGRRMIDRSEERRVGKECRSGWSRHHYKEKRQRRVSE